MTKIIVLHRYYGCDSGCCGHVIEVDGKETGGDFQFDHPGAEADRAFAEQKIREELGEEHVKDLDWENCVICSD